MEDPRLTELTFLNDLEMERIGEINVESGKRYGLSRSAFQSMVIHLLTKRAVLPWNLVTEYLQDPAISSHIVRAIGQLKGLKKIKLGLPHAGRRYLWELKLALESASEMEEFGIIYSRKTMDIHLPVKLALVSEGSPLSLLFMDFDNFKSVNDTFGHPVGDVALKLLFTTVKHTVSSLGSSYRYGGDEVLVILPEVVETEAGSLSDSIRKNAEEAFKKMKELKENNSDKKDITPTVSIGRTTLMNSIPVKEALKKVDDALLKAKVGKNQVYPPVGS